MMLRVDMIRKFDPTSWLDMCYLYSSALVLVLAIICEVRRFHSFEAAQRQSQWIADSMRLLAAASELASKQLENPLVPGTMHRYAVVISDMHSMTNDFVMGHAPRTKDPTILGAKQTRPLTQSPSSPRPCRPPWINKHICSRPAATSSRAGRRRRMMNFAQDGYMQHGAGAFMLRLPGWQHVVVG